MINKRQKRLKATLGGGIGAHVIDGDLGFAIRIWKQELKRSGIINEVFERNQGFVKPSIIKKNMISKAKHKQRKITEANK